MTPNPTENEPTSSPGPSRGVYRTYAMPRGLSAADLSEVPVVDKFATVDLHEAPPKYDRKLPKSSISQHDHHNDEHHVDFAAAAASIVSESVVSSAQTGRIYSATEDFPSRMISCGGMNRFVILAIGLLFFSSLQSSVICYNATYVSIMDRRTSPLFNGSVNDATIDWNSFDLPLNERRLMYGFVEKSVGFGVAFLGSMTGTIPLNMLMQRRGAHIPMTIIGIMATVLTALTPMLISSSIYGFWILRIFAGLAISNIFPVAGMIVNNWGMVKEKGLFVAVLSGYIELSAMFTMPMSGIISAKLGWPWSFYIHSIICGVFTVLWALYYRDKATSHPFLGRQEFRKISHGKAPARKTSTSTPIKRIIHSFVIWSVWIACIGNFLVAQFSISYAPMYLSYVLGFTPTESGVITIAPLFMQLLIKFFTGLASDKLTMLSEVAKLRLFNTIALLGSGTFFIVLSGVTPGNASLFIDVLLMVIPVALLGFSSGGFSKCAVMVSRQHSPFVMSIVQILACVSLLAGSFIVPALTTNDTFEQWRNVFILYGAVLVITNTIFIAFARSEPAKWAVDPVEPPTAPQEAAQQNNSA